MEKLRRSIRRTLKARGISLEALAAKAKIGRATLFELMREDGQLPRFSTLTKLRDSGVRIPRDLFE